MSDIKEALELALEALEQSGVLWKMERAHKAIKEALAGAEGERQPEQEPVRVMGFDCVCGRRMKVSAEQGVTPAPQRTWEKPWVSLTDEEIDRLPTHLSSRSKRRLYCTIEAKLKEKNT